MASFKPNYIIPGHRHITNLVEASKDTYDYLVFLRDEIRKVVANDDCIMIATNINQDKFNYLKILKALQEKMPNNVFLQLEFEN
ncbi:hypothetical protein [Bathymodiolus septemdierum thioautotrophic gill symbiont]|uniref:hypothetical protein n=1 Tax=Bathymodiolus septemdierum thioautotrophic gill symbiont TaxID=113267 RepID=UPI0008245DC7|nr:hypothetical protein [Bathymodiolus septemdierum thioautotrophic gill symbiont]